MGACSCQCEKYGLAAQSVVDEAPGLVVQAARQKALEEAIGGVGIPAFPWPDCPTTRRTDPPCARDNGAASLMRKTPQRCARCPPGWGSAGAACRRTPGRTSGPAWNGP